MSIVLLILIIGGVTFSQGKKEEPKAEEVKIAKQLEEKNEL